jgi:predicted DNA-binding transcriptional regulator YafY
VIATACRDSERLRFSYRSREGVDSRRDVEPRSLVNSGRRWYLVACDRDREDWRTFRLDRLARPSSTGARFQPRPLPAPDAAAFVEQRLADVPHRYEARVTLHAAADEVAGRVPAHWGTIEVKGPGRCEFRTGDDDLDWLALRIAMLGVDFEAHEPPELAEHLRSLAGRLARAAERPPRRDLRRSARDAKDVEAAASVRREELPPS